jgi:type II restriction/modification system DNA methylase subunit YeeA
MMYIFIRYIFSTVDIDNLLNKHVQKLLKILYTLYCGKKKIYCFFVNGTTWV